MTVALLFFSLPLWKLWSFFFCLFIFFVYLYYYYRLLIMTVITVCVQLIFLFYEVFLSPPLAKGHLPCFSGSLLDEINLLFTVFTVVGVCVCVSERAYVRVCDEWKFVYGAGKCQYEIISVHSTRCIQVLPQAKTTNIYRTIQCTEDVPREAQNGDQHTTVNLYQPE